MNDLIITQAKFETTSKKLNKELDGIVKAFENNEKAGEKLASHLYQIKADELWKISDDENVFIGDKEIKKFGDVAGIFGIGTQQAYKLAKAYELKYYEEVLTERLSLFKLSQIIEMMTLDVTDLVVVIDEEIVKPTMTLKQIRDAVSNYKKGDEDVEEIEDNEPTDDTDGEELDTTYKVVISGAEFIIEDVKVQKAITKVLEKYGIINYVED